MVNIPHPKYDQARFVIREATLEDLPSLATILARSFHPVNPYVADCFPDTPAIRAWWTDIFTSAIQDPTIQPLVVSDERRQSAQEESVQGILVLRHVGASGMGAGFWRSHPWTEDHNRAACDNMINSMDMHHNKLMKGHEHFIVELFGMDDSCKGLGLGKMLLSRACEIIDATGLECFVQANGSAEHFYERLGFKLRDEVVLPGEHKYRECMLVRASAR